MLADGAVHVWRIHLDVEPATAAFLTTTLSDEELARAGRLRGDQARTASIVGRAALRDVLASYLDHDPASLPLERGRHGKPFLAGENCLEFNLSRSRGLALCAVRRTGAVGVDIEAIRPRLDHEAIARHVLSIAERRHLADTPEDGRSAAFLTIWVRKEALAKAWGDGLSFPFDRFDVASSRNAQPALTEVRGRPDEAARWSLSDLPVGPGYAAAVAANHFDSGVWRWEWSPSDSRPRHPAHRVHTRRRARDDAYGTTTYG